MNIVVSGASSGIGFEVSRQLAVKGHKVLAIARSKHQLELLATKHDNIHILTVDLTEKIDLNEALQAFIGAGRIDALINNAGQLINKSFENSTIDDFKQQFDANVITMINLTKACLSYMNSPSHIVNISSMGGVQGSSKFPGLSAYSSAKGAVSILSECLAVELAEKEISVNALALGAVQTEMLEKAFPDYKAPMNSIQMAEYISDFALNGHQYYNGKVLPVAVGNP